MIIAMNTQHAGSDEIEIELAEIAAARAAGESVVLSDAAALAIAANWQSPDSALASLATGFPRDHRVIADAIASERLQNDYDHSVGKLEVLGEDFAARDAELRALGEWLHETVGELSEAGQADDGYLQWLESAAGEVLTSREGAAARSADELELCLAIDLVEIIAQTAVRGPVGLQILSAAMIREGSDLAQGCTLSVADLGKWVTDSRTRLDQLSEILQAPVATSPMSGHWDYLDNDELGEEYAGEARDWANVLTDYAAALGISQYDNDGYVLEVEADAIESALAYL